MTINNEIPLILALKLYSLSQEKAQAFTLNENLNVENVPVIWGGNTAIRFAHYVQP